MEFTHGEENTVVMTDSQACCTAQPTPSSPNSNPFKTWQNVVELDVQLNGGTRMPENNNPNGGTTGPLVNGETPYTDSDSEMMESEMQHRTRQLRKNLRLDLAGTNANADANLPPPKSSWLLRLFESKLFDMSIAIAYLFNSKEPGVLTYLGNKLFVSTFYTLNREELMIHEMKFALFQVS